MKDKLMYFHHVAKTHVRHDVLEEMMPCFSKNHDNAFSMYLIGRESKKAIEKAREKVALILGADAKEIFFVDSGTDADNWAIKSVAYANRNKGNHIITTAIEHNAVLHSCKNLEHEGFDVTYLPVDRDGLVTPKQVKEAIKPETILISVMFSNNEIGTIHSISEIGKIARETGVYFHTDDIQAMGNISVNVTDLNVDMLSIVAHKSYGPKGLGILYIRKGTNIIPFMHCRVAKKRQEGEHLKYP